MTKSEFRELVEFIVDRWGDNEPWSNAVRFASDFEGLDSDAVWAAMDAWGTQFPETAAWPPKPPALRAAALIRMRVAERPALPESTGSYGWAEFSRRTYGEEISLREAVERTWAKAGKR